MDARKLAEDGFLIERNDKEDIVASKRHVVVAQRLHADESTGAGKGVRAMQWMRANWLKTVF